jgi:hypothetical protein
MNWRAPIVAKLDLVNINTADGDFGFIAGLDGRFTDVNGKTWIGSSLIQASAQESALNGKAPSGEITMAYYQDPSMPDLAAQIRALGVQYIQDRPITFYVQAFGDVGEFYAPKTPPIQIYKRRMKSLSFSVEGDQLRRLTLSFESSWEDRRSAQRRIYNTVDHSAAVGALNPSLEFIPTNNFQEEKLFG